MKKGKIRYTAFLLAIMLLLSIVQPLAPKASPATANEAIQLVKGDAVVGSFSEPGDVQWYKIEPTNEEIQRDTHMKIVLSGTFEGNISVYPDKDRAEEDFTFDDYRAEITEGAPAVIYMPHAWTGPYFIKVEYYGNIEEIDEVEGETEEPQGADYEISYEGKRLTPSDLSEEACPVELSVNKRAAGVEILKELRQVRDELLSKTDKGQEVTSLYYKIAPFLVTKMTFDKETRDQAYKSLVTLKPIFSELAEKGDASSYRLNKADQIAINELYEIVIQNVPDWLKPEIEKIAKEIGIDKLIGKEVSAILKENKMAVSQSDTDRVIVKLKSGKTKSVLENKAKRLAKSPSFKTVKGNGTSLNNMYVLDEVKKPEELAKNLEELPEVEYAEPVYTYHKNATDQPVFDAQYSSQWSLENTGEGFGKAGADIQFRKFYKTINNKQLEEVVIAVVDTGVDYTLADLEEIVLRDEGYDFVNRDEDAYDDEGHGTHVAGIIAAGMDNNYSMTGIHPNAKILPVKVLDASGSGDTEKIALGIKYAVDEGKADVINLSLGGPYSRVIEEQLKYAASKNVTIVAASGNDGADMLDYPAASKHSIAVGASNRLDIVSDFSSYGEGLDLVAPGSDIPSLLPNGNVTYLSGTSMAAPHVAAAAGLLLSVNKDLKREEVRRILTETAEDIAVEEPVSQPDYYDDDFPVRVLEPGYDEVSGWGRLNVWSAFNTVGLRLAVDPLTDNDMNISGKAVKGMPLELMDGETSLGKGVAKADEKFSFKITPQQGNKVLHLVANDGAASVRVSVKETPAPEIPIVKPVSDSDTVVTGQAEKGTTVAVKSKKKLLGEVKVDAKGHFKVKIEKQKAGTQLLITSTSVSKKVSKTAKVVVIDKTPPAKPKVNSVGDSDQFVGGKTEPGATVIVKLKGKTIGKKKVDAKGTFKVAIKKQKAGTVLSVTAKDAAGNESKATKVTVKDKTPPAVPKVNKVTDRDKFITGKTEKNAVVYVKHKGKTLGKKKADAKGKFKVKIKKQKAGTTLSVTAKDAAGNTSKAAKIKVKNYKK
ncbi:peptidase S8 [Siminovitchia acidinfaciens]|uniref:Peptidase S8 n=1 Tax=Siminovitchia acidinfaciens TaxID=2321395 RepID=A0A429Y7K3_9BACI|nr:Ig-like domain-containing protein [Siminovitchia acidinfaciens]RST77439.1 peptidase S8 [Siminovitchia acidinfaciens]